LALTLALALGLGMALSLLWLLADGLPARAAPAGELHVCPSGCAYSSVQAAVDAANTGDVIKVAAGTYTGIHARDGITQVVYISKSVTIRGGYTTSDWTASDPSAHPTTLDAQGQGRVLVVSETAGVTLEGLGITGGDAEGLGSGPLAYDAGGGVYAYYAPSLTVAGCDVYSNSAKTVELCCGYGGGLYLRSSDYALVEGNAIHHNWGNRAGHGNGGALYADRSHHIVLRNNAVHHNVATTLNGRGGGLYLSDSDYALLDGNVLRDNSASVGVDAWGGGVVLEYADHARVTNNVIRNNVASHWTFGYGGGMVVLGSVDATLDNNVIVSNATSLNPGSRGFGGGGLYLEGSDATLVNTVLADNWASAHGSGVYVLNGSPRFLHTTIARNRGEGGGVFVDSCCGHSSSVALTNTVLFSHSVGITVTTGNTATLNATLWRGNDTDRAGAGTINHTNDRLGDPAFAADGYHLTSPSAAVDKGLEAGVLIDIDGDPRPAGPLPDLGADEFWKRVFLPLVMRGHAPSH
jgi:hypothetical protein